MYKIISGITRREILFFTAFWLFISCTFFSSTLFSRWINFSLLRYAMFLGVSLLLIIKFLTDQKYKHALLYMLLAVLFLLVGLHSENLRDLLLIALFIVEARNIDFMDIARSYYRIVGLYLAVTVILFFVGMFSNVDVVMYRTTSNIARASMGFSFTTYGANFYMAFVTAFLYVKRGKRYIPIYILLLAGAYLFFYFTNTKIAFIETIFIILLSFMTLFINDNIYRSKIVRFIFTLAFIVGAILSFAVTMLYQKNGPLEIVNQKLNYRLSLGKSALEQYSVTLLGNKISWALTSGDDYFYVDSSYIQVLLQYGLVIFLLFILLFTLLMRNRLQEMDIMGVWCLVIIALHAVTDPQLLNLVYNPFLLMVTFVIKGRNKGLRNDKYF